MNNRFLRMFLLLAVVVASLLLLQPTQAQAEILHSGTCGTNITWTVDDRNVLTISGNGPIVYAEGTSAPWHPYRSVVETVIIENGVTSISNGCFGGFDDMTDITIADTVLSIGEKAFSYCTSLEQIDLSDNLLTIGTRAFEYCKALKSIDIPEQVTVIGDSAFTICSALKTVTLGNSLQTIGAYAFGGCAIETIVFPDSLRVIGRYAFDNCRSLKTVYIGRGLTEIQEQAFSYANVQDTYIKDANAWCKVAMNAVLEGKTHFLDDSGNEVSEVVLDRSVTAIPQYAFRGSNITSIEIPDTVMSIGDSAFSGCAQLTEITIPDSVKTIGSYAFSSCTGLEEVNLGSGIDRIRYCSFSHCEKLKQITLPDAVTSIESYAFTYCKALQKITIPDNTKTIQYNAFDNCTSLRIVVVGKGTQTIENSVFAYCPNIEMVTFRNPDTTDMDEFNFRHSTKLVTVYSAGTEEQWNAYRNNVNFPNSGAEITFYFEHVHDYSQTEPVEVLWCEEEGYVEYTCVHGDTYRDLLPPGHTFSEGSCIRCGEKVPFGDLNGDGTVGVMDVIALLLYVTMPEDFNIATEADFDGNDTVDVGDAIRLLLYVTMPEDFPLVPATKETL